MNKPIWIVGLQKSGTSLLVHLLEESGLGVSHSGKVEDTWFWGDRPSFSPREWPSGMIYQHYEGESGHEIGKEWANPEINEYFRAKLAAAMKKITGGKVLFGKNPYNSVRVPWLRALFPDSIIVAMVRCSFSNVYSLWKRYIPGAHTAPPEEGWWGVKPSRWRELVQDDKINQIAAQWVAVNQKLNRDCDLIDLVIPYHALCADPRYFIKKIISLSMGRECSDDFLMPELRCFDNEYRTGSCLLSKNKYRTGTLQPGEGSVELAPFGAKEMDTIKRVCRKLSMEMGL